MESASEVVQVCEFLTVEGMFGCTFCEEVCIGPKTIKFELAKDGWTSQEMLSCVPCGVKYGNDYRMLVNSARTQYKCSVCGKLFRTINNGRHIRNEHILKPAYRSTCKDCGKTFTNEQKYKDHAKRHDPKTICCDICHTLLRKADMNMHFRTHIKPFPCTLCEKRFGQKPQLQIHMKYIHDGVKRSRVKCKHCDKTYSHRPGDPHLVYHMATAHGVKTNRYDKYECKYCKIKLQNNYQLNLHIRVHTKEKPYKCPMCEKTFTGLGARAMHIRVHHTKEKYFSCQHCSRSFHNAGLLLHHKRRFHTFEKPYQCKFCSWKFCMNKSLELHMLTHTQERRHVCSVCKASFKKSTGLCRHSLIHSKKAQRKRKKRQ